MVKAGNLKLDFMAKSIGIHFFEFEDLLRCYRDNENLKKHFGHMDTLKVRDCFLIHKPQRFVNSDASATGCGAVITLNEEHICQRLWEPSECSKSSTWRELTAIDFSLESFAPVL